MFNIKHNDAMALEHIVRKLYDCDRSGVSGLADADHFESSPFDAAVMVVSFIYAKHLQLDQNRYDEFLGKYNTIFKYPNENDANSHVQNYISELENIVNSYC